SKRSPSTLTRSPTTISRRPSRRGSPRTRSSRWLFALPSVRPHVSTMLRSRPWPRLRLTMGGASMRLEILNSGYSFGKRVLFAIFPVPDVVKLSHYRPDFYGKPNGRLLHEAMRGPSAWSVGDRELMAAVVSKTNECEF